MSINSVEKFNINSDGLNLYKTYNWIEQKFSPALEEALQEFWKLSFEFKLICVGENYNFFTFGSEYFVTRIKISKENQFSVRLSKEVVQILLDSTLGCNPNFEFEKITELEAKMLTAFNNLIYTKFSQYMLKEDEKKDISGECHLAFLINCGFDEQVKIIVSIPSSYLNFEEVFPSQDRFGLGDFANTKALTNLYVGSASLPLNDIKTLEKEDIIVLENSNINNMVLKFEDNEIGFKVSPDPSLIINFDDDNGSKNMSKSENIWDNIQVDISAEFEKVKISLGEIKQISEGLVVDMGSVYDNQVDLKVENKVIARGELVIINDRYGVRVNEIFEDENKPSKDISYEDISDLNENSNENEEQISNEETVSQNSEEQTNNETEEFDYNDFEVDDENI